MRRAGTVFQLLAAAAAIFSTVGCGSGGGLFLGTGGSSGTGGAAGAGGGGGGGGAVTINPLVISVATRSPRTTTWSVNYWQWAPAYGDDVSGTESLMAPITPAIMRVGGYNNDANVPNPFGEAQLDQAVAYARAIGAEPLIQVPRIADTDGQPSTPATAAGMVTYANVTMGYGIKYFAVGNEPDLYDTQGAPGAMTQPAMPGYTPSDFCTAQRAYVTAMKAVDPTIQIVGPDLAYKYQAGAGASLDWLTPILQTCGDLFDIVAIHRYPFEAMQAALPVAAHDPASFKNTIASVRGIMQSAGQGAKPLALTEMNVAYDATTCVLDASPGTVGSALWLADSLGAAMDVGLWTSAVWNIADSPDWAMGLIGVPPAHTPRPQYYAYQLYAAHFGPTLVQVSSAPAGVSAHASRNQADTATEIIVVNWNEAPEGLAVQVDGLAGGAAPALATFVVPAVSISALEIPDTGAPQAWTYAEAQRAAAVGPAALAPGLSGTTTPPDGGAGGAGGGAGRIVGSGCPTTDGGVVCAQTTLPSPAITTLGTMNGTALNFGAGSNRWGSYTYAGPGQTSPTGTVTSSGNGVQITGGLVPPLSSSNNFIGIGLYYSSNTCIDGSTYTGLQFDFSGDLGGCAMQVGMSSSGDISSGNDSTRGGCNPNVSSCYGPSVDVTTVALAATAAAPTIRVPFASVTGGMPQSLLDSHTIVTVQWALSGTIGGADGGACSASFTVSNVSFY
jgi:hypothetical protein